jgi:predicted methyltransferase
MTYRRALVAALLAASLPLTACQSVDAMAPAVDSTALQAAIASPSRTDANRARDPYRHPYETLSFFGVRPNHTVVEIWPGGGWYTEILGPYLTAGGGRLIAATPNGQLGGVAKLKDGNPAQYGHMIPATFPVFDNGARVTGVADVVLTFRNVHNWKMGSRREDKQDYSADAFRQMYAMLKPGGVLGVVEHRLPESASDEREKSSGYVKTSTVRRLAEQAGFRFDGASEINANPMDTADWEKGVWTLPPTLTLKDVDRAKYQAIGESDRMTLRFVKPR